MTTTTTTPQKYPTIPISSIIVGDRLRKNHGDIQSLANNIAELGLLSPIVVNEKYQLLAGERRLEACKLLGWTEVDVCVKQTADAEMDLAVELAENINRKEFTREETINAGLQIERIEKIKAEERMKAGKADPVQNFAQGKTRVIVAEKLGISHTQYEREKFIVENRSYLTPGEYDDWNNRIISTNKVYTTIKKAMNPPVAVTKTVAPDDYNDLKDKVKTLTAENKKLQNTPPTEILPPDYEELKSKVSALNNECDRLRQTITEKDSEIDSLLEKPAEDSSLEIAALKRQVDDLNSSLESSEKTCETLRKKNADLLERAEDLDRRWTPEYFASEFAADLTDSACLNEFCANATVMINKISMKSNDVRLQRALRNDDQCRGRYLELLDFIDEWLRKEYAKANGTITIIDAAI